MALKVLKSMSSEENEDVAYLTKKFITAMKKSVKFHKKGKNSRSTGAIKVCHKCGKPWHFIKDCPLHKMNYQEYLKSKWDKAKNKDGSLTSTKGKL